jgi:bacterioferritin (cytochrome b1)
MRFEERAAKKGFGKILKNLLMPYLSEKEELLKILNDNYSKELAIAKMMSEHAEMIPFDFLRERLKKLAEEEKTHAEKLKQKIVELGGAVNPSPKIYEIKTSSIHSEKGFRKLIADLEFDKEIYEDYIAQINRIENEDVKRLLREIVEDEVRHKDVLMDIVMRLC